jgi:hypothetical protein
MRIVGIVALVFGLLTIVSGGRALFGDEAAREAVGAAVPFVLWFNFAAGFAYVAAGLGLMWSSPWGAALSALIAAATCLVFTAFGLHVFFGGAYEMRTVGAMTLRSVVWLAFALAAWRTIGFPGERRGPHGKNAFS